MTVRPPEPILHLDIDAFYAAVEALDDPSLAGRPLLVGGAGGRGVVASASYEARAFGVSSAMPMAKARRLCPDAVVRSPRFDRYRQVSAALLDLLRDVTPLVEPLSLDEAFLDVGGSRRLLGEPPEIAAHLRARIHAELGLPASVGVAPNLHLAKLCSQRAKPDGIRHLRREEVSGFLSPLPVRALWGVGEATAERLARFGLRTVADVAAADAGLLRRVVGPAAAGHLAELAAGEDPRTVTPYEPAKSISAEETFAADVDEPEVLRREVLRLAEDVARRLRAEQVATRTVTLKLRYDTFQTVTRSRTLDTPADDGAVLHREATAALAALRLQRARVRLVGVGASNLVPAGAARQLDLLGDDRWSRLERAADAAGARFGAGTVTRVALLEDAPTSGDAAPTGDAWRRVDPGDEPPRP